MHERFDRFGWDDSPYERVEQKWICGRACERGPVSGGIMRRSRRCRGTTACAPTRKGDGWACTRRTLQTRAEGGKHWLPRPCDEGPTTDGTCSHSSVPCRPGLSLRAKRRRLAAGALVLCLLGPLFLAMNPAGESFFSPGPLSEAHAGLRCDDCHEAAREGVTSWPSHALQAHKEHTEESCSCLQCHRPELLADPFRAHGLPHAELDRRHPDGSGAGGAKRWGWLHEQASALARARAHGTQALTCTGCHSEHEGRKTYVRGKGPDDCRVCHLQEFESFHVGHPEFGVWPHERRAPIAFDHRRHLEEWFDGESVSCASCHQPGPDGRGMRANFERDCQRCHAQDVTFDEDRVLTILPPSRVDGSVPLTSFAQILLGDHLPEYAAMPQATRQALRLDPRGAPVPASLAQAWGEAARELTQPREQAQAALLQRLRKTLGQDVAVSRDQLNVLVDAGLQRAARTAQDSGSIEPGRFGRRNGALVYRPKGHPDPVLAAWLPLAAAYHAQRGDWQEHFVDQSILGSCLGCHNADREADGRLRIHWSGRRPFRLVPFSHLPHHMGLKASLIEHDCQACHEMTGAGSRHRFTATGDVDPYGSPMAQPTHSDFAPIRRETCATCHDRPAIPSDCSTCHRYHTGAFRLSDVAHARKR